MANSKLDYDEVAQKIHQLREKKDKAIMDNFDQDEQRRRITDMMSFLQEQEASGVEYDEKLVHWLIEKVIVHDEKFLIEFKSGVKVKIAG